MEENRRTNKPRHEQQKKPKTSRIAIKLDPVMEVRMNLLTDLTFAGKEVRKGARWGSGSAVW